MGWGAGQWGDEDEKTDLLRGRGEALEASPAVNLVNWAGGGSVSWLEGWRGVPEDLSSDLAGSEGELVAK